jgi:Fe-S-cluster containining protein
VAQGLRFECQRGCTECCRRRGFVYLTENDLLRAAEFLGMSPAAFEKRYVYRTRRLLRLRTPRDLRCHFLRDSGCSIHPVKPAQCRLFPFWAEMVENPREWRKAATWCPGIGKGPLVQIETARRDAAEMRESYPTLY